MTNIKHLAGIGLALALAGGCGGTGQDTAGSAPAARAEAAPTSPGLTSGAVAAAPVDAAVVRGRSEYDYPQTASVLAAARAATSVLVGEVVGWRDGTTTVETDGKGYEDLSHTAVMEVVVDTAGRTTAQRPGETAWVQVYRGGELKIDGETPAGTVPARATVEELAAAVPAGTRVIVLADAARTADQLVTDTPGAQVVSLPQGLPEGATLIQPRPQGLLFRDADGSFVSGVADGERDWGWLPRGVPATRGFDLLVSQLARLS